MPALGWRVFAVRVRMVVAGSGPLRMFDLPARSPRPGRGTTGRGAAFLIHSML